MRYSDGRIDSPVLVNDLSEGFSVCRDRNQPTVVDSLDEPTLCRCYPSGALVRIVNHSSRAAPNSAGTIATFRLKV